MSWPWTTWWVTGLGLSGQATVFIAIDIVAAAGPDQRRRARTVSGVT